MNDENQSGNFNQASSSFSNDEKKQDRKEAVGKAGQVSARAAADVYTGGAYEAARNIPIVGGVVKGVEKGVGKVVGGVANAASLGTAGRVADPLNKAGVIDAADQAVGMMGGAANKPKNTNPNPDAMSHSDDLSPGKKDKKDGPLPKEEPKPKPKPEESTLTPSSEGSNTLKTVVGVKAAGCVISFLFLAFIFMIPIIFLIGGGNTKSTMNEVACSSNSENCEGDTSGGVASFGERVSNLFRYGSFATNSKVFANKIMETYESFYAEYQYAINRELLIATLAANIDDLSVIYDDNNNGTISATVLKRLEYINETAELQMVFGNVVYYCDVKEVDGKRMYYLSVPETPVDESLAIKGSCNILNVGKYLKIQTSTYDEEEYFKKLEGSNVLTLLYPDYGEDKSTLVEKIKNQYYIYKQLYVDEEDVGNIPITLTQDSNVNLQVPLRGPYYITSPFGKRGTIYSGTNIVADGDHLGIDVVPYNDKNIYAAGNGVVTRANFESTGGNIIEITHTTSTGEKYISQYAHLNAFYVRQGDTVNSGDLIAEMGSTGAATGPHLHFGMKDLQTNEWLNPRNLFSGATNY